MKTAMPMKLKVVNILSDGTRLDSMEGITIPAGIGYYEAIAEIARRNKDERNHIDD